MRQGLIVNLHFILSFKQGTNFTFFQHIILIHKSDLQIRPIQVQAVIFASIFGIFLLVLSI
jgi:hypothetical protein